MGGKLGFNGDIRLHDEHRERISAMVWGGGIPGQKKDDSAREHMLVTLWWEECSVWRTWLRSDAGMMILSL